MFGLKINMAARNSKLGKLIVAAIDFGTTYSGYAYSFKHDFERDPLKIYCHSWTDGISLVTYKVPTTVLFDQNGDFHSFGYEAEEKYAKLSSTDKHIGWKYFRRFKMTLHNKSVSLPHLESKKFFVGHFNLMLKTKLRDDQGKRMEAVKVFSAAISYLKDHLLSRLNESYIEAIKEMYSKDAKDACVNSADILWVLTVPAIWSDSAKQFMRTAAVQAGIPEDQLLLALEPEAAAIYTKTAVLSKKKTDDANAFTKDSKFMVIDLGGGTVDITVHKVDKDGKFHEIYPPSGGPWGGTLVDEKILEFIEDLFGTKVLDLLKKESNTEEIDMLRTLELKKRQFKFTDDDDDGRVNLTLPSTLYEIYDEENPNYTFSKKLKELYPQGVDKRRGRLVINHDLFLDMFTESIDNLKGHLEKICRRPEMRDVNTLVMVGGYSECDVIKTSMKEAFKDTRVIIPEEAAIAVVKGAVLFGHNPNVIDSRRAPSTYGISTAVPFDHRVHEAEHQYNNMCEDVFKVFLTIGTEIVPGQTHVTQNFNSAMSSSIEIYKSISETPSFITDAGCEKIGEIDIENPAGGEIEVTMWFGDTELQVEAKEHETGNQIAAKFKFLR